MAKGKDDIVQNQYDDKDRERKFLNITKEIKPVTRGSKNEVDKVSRDNERYMRNMTASFNRKSKAELDEFKDEPTLSNNTFSNTSNSTLTDADMTSNPNSGIIVKPMGKQTTVTDIINRGNRANLKMQSAMVAFHSKIAERTFSTMNLMNKSIAEMSTFQKNVQAKYYETSLSYKKDMLQELRNITNILKVGFNIKDKGNGRYEINNGNSKQSGLLDSMFGGGKGGFLKGLASAAKGTAMKQISGGAFGDLYDVAQAIIPLMGQMNGSSIARMIAGQAGRYGVKKALGHRQGENLFNWMENPRDMFQKFAESMQTSNNKLLKDFFSHFAENNAQASEILNIKDYMKRDPKGRANFDVMTHRSINEVVPYHLANIEGYMKKIATITNGGRPTGPDGNYFNHNTGKFETMEKAISRMDMGGGDQLKKAVKDYGKRINESLMSDIASEVDNRGKQFIKSLMANNNAGLNALKDDLIQLGLIYAQMGRDLLADVQARTFTEKDLFALGMYRALDPKTKMNRANGMCALIRMIKRIPGPEAQQLLEDIFDNNFRAQYDKDLEILKNMHGASVSTFAAWANGKMERKNSNGTTEQTNGYYSMTDFNLQQQIRSTNKNVQFSAMYNNDTLEKEVAKMVGYDYYLIVTNMVEMKARMQNLEDNNQSESIAYKSAQKIYEMLEKQKRKMEEKIGVNRIAEMKDTYIKNGYQSMKNKLDFSGDILADVGTFNKWLGEYASTVAGERNIKFAGSAGAGAMVYKMMKSMGGGPLMSPLLGVIAGGSLLMSKKMNKMVELLGESGDIVMDNGKTRKENALIKIMQDALPAGFATATGIKVSKFIKNHVRFGGILGPILGTVTGGALYAVGKSGLFKGMLKAFTFLPRMIFKKMFGKDAYNSAAKWIDEKTGGYFSGSTPSWREIFDQDKDAHNGPAMQKSALKVLDDYHSIEIENMKEFIWPRRGYDDEGNVIDRFTGQTTGAKIENFHKREHLSVFGSIESINEYYRTMKENLKAFTNRTDITSILTQVSSERNIGDKVNQNMRMREIRVGYDRQGNEINQRNWSIDDAGYIHATVTGRQAVDAESAQNYFNQFRYNDSEAQANRGQKFEEEWHDVETTTSEEPQGSGYGGAPNRRDQNRIAGKFGNMTAMSEAGCAILTMSYLVETFTDTDTDPEDIKELAEPYMKGKGIHIRFFSYMADRLNFKYTVNNLRGTQLDKLTKWIQSNKKLKHIVLLSKRRGHGHYILIDKIKNNGECEIYDPLKPKRRTMKLGSILTNATHIISFEKGKGSINDVEGNSNANPAIRERNNNMASNASSSIGASGLSGANAYGKRNTKRKEPIAVTIVGGHLDAVGIVGSIDMEGYKEKMRMLGSSSSSGEENPGIKKYANNIYNEVGKNKYLTEQQKEQDSQEERERQNTDALLTIAGKKSSNKKEKEEKKGFNWGMLGNIGKMLLGGGMITAIGGAILGWIKNKLGLGNGKGMKEFFSNMFSKGGKDAGKKTLLEKLGGAFKGGKEFLFGSKGTEVVEKTWKMNTETAGKIYAELGQEGFEKAQRYAANGVRVGGKAGGEMLENVTRVGQKGNLIQRAMKSLAKLIVKVGKFISKIPVIGPFMKKLNLVDKMPQAIQKVLEEASKEITEDMTKKASKKSLMSTIKGMSLTNWITAGISLAMYAWDVYQAWNNTPEYFQTAQPTLLMKVCSGFVGFILSVGGSDFLTPLGFICNILSMFMVGNISRMLYSVLTNTLGIKDNDQGKMVDENKWDIEVDEYGNQYVSRKDGGGKNTRQLIGDLAGKALNVSINSAGQIVDTAGNIIGYTAGQVGTTFAAGMNNQFFNQQTGQKVQFSPSTNNSSSGSSDGTQAGNGSRKKYSGRGAYGSIDGDISVRANGTIRSKVANGLTFVSQDIFMSNRNLGGENMSLNGCAISCMKMISSHLGLKINDMELISVARKYLDKGNAVNINYFTEFGGSITEDPMSVLTSLSSPDGAVVLLINKGEGQHFVTVFNKGNKLFLGDPEMSDFQEIGIDSYILQGFISAVTFSGYGDIRGGGEIQAGNGSRKRRAGRGVAKVGFANNLSKIIGDTKRSISNTIKNNKPGDAFSKLNSNPWVKGGQVVPGSSSSNNVGPSTTAGGNYTGDALFRKIRQQQTLNEGSYTVDAGGPTMFGVIQKNARELMGYTGDMKKFPWAMADKYWHDHWFKNANILDFKNWKVGFATMDLMGANPSIGTDTLIAKAKEMGVTMPSKTTGGIGLKAPSKELIAEINKLPEDKAQQLALNIQDRWLTLKSGGKTPNGYINRAKYNKNFIQTGIAGGLATDGKPGTFTWDGIKYGADGPVSGKGSRSKMKKFFGGRGKSRGVSKLMGSVVGAMTGSTSMGKMTEDIANHTIDKKYGTTSPAISNAVTDAVKKVKDNIKSNLTGGKSPWMDYALKEVGSTNAGKYKKGGGGSWCMAFIWWCFAQAGSKLPYTEASQAPVNDSANWVQISNPVYGCVIVFTNEGDPSHGHVDFYIGPGKSQKFEVVGGNNIHNGTSQVRRFERGETSTYKGVTKKFKGFYVPKDMKDKLGGSITDVTGETSPGGDGTSTGGAGTTTTPATGVKFYDTVTGKSIDLSDVVSRAVNKLSGNNAPSGGTDGGASGTTSGGNPAGSGAAVPGGIDLVSGLPVEAGGSVNDDSIYAKLADACLDSPVKGIKPRKAVKSQKYCATAINNALGKVFGNRPGYNANAYYGGRWGHSSDSEAAQLMQSLGFKKISIASSPQVGDIVAMTDPRAKVPGSPNPNGEGKCGYGHVTMYVGTRGDHKDRPWCSDFSQLQAFVYSSVGKIEDCRFTLWRYAGDGTNATGSGGTGGSSSKAKVKNVGGNKKTYNSTPTQRSTNTSSGLKMERGAPADDDALDYRAEGIQRMLRTSSSRIRGTNNFDINKYKVGEFNNTGGVIKSTGTAIAKTKSNSIMSKSGDASSLTFAILKESIDKLNENMEKQLQLNKGMLKVNSAQLETLVEVSSNTKKIGLTSVANNIKDQNKFQKLQEKLKEWTKDVTKDYKVATIPTS
jgi:CHAP domain|nr:MAG TPA: TIGR02594 family protein [Caudoviricetes sp.]